MTCSLLLKGLYINDARGFGVFWWMKSHFNCAVIRCATFMHANKYGRAVGNWNINQESRQMWWKWSNQNWGRTAKAMPQDGWTETQNIWRLRFARKAWVIADWTDRKVCFVSHLRKRVNGWSIHGYCLRQKRIKYIWADCRPRSKLMDTGQYVNGCLMIKREIRLPK